MSPPTSTPYSSTGPTADAYTKPPAFRAGAKFSALADAAITTPPASRPAHALLISDLTSTPSPRLEELLPELRPLEHALAHELDPARPLPRGQRLAGDLLLPEQRVHELVDRAHEELVGVPNPVRGDRAPRHRHLEEQIVRLHPVVHEALDGPLPPAGEDHVRVVVERAPVAHHHLVLARGADLLRHLGGEDPGLGLQ